MYSESLSPQITIPARITPRSSTLIDNIFTNTVNESLVSGNLTFSISDHLAQFLIYPELTINNKEKKIPQYKKNYKKSQHNQIERRIRKLKLDRTFKNTKVQYGHIFRNLVTNYKHTT